MRSVLFALTVLSFSSFGLETDQFLPTNIVLKDSAPIINDYFEQQIAKAIDKANSKNPEKVACTELAGNVLNNLVGGKYFSISKISKFARTSPFIDRYPDDSVSDSEYRKMSFYENSDILLKMAAFARTINVNGIYMGTDKLGHFSLLGRNYYHNYLSFRKDGLNKDQAIEKAILKGFKTEKGLLGYSIGGVLSFGDLEANYEGMMFALKICDEQNPYVLFKDGKYIRNTERPFDLKEYFNPRMDESYLLSFWRPGLYKRIKPKLEKEYCATVKDPMYQERISKYPPIVENLNDRLIREHILTIPKFERKLEDVQSFCE